MEMNYMPGLGDTLTYALERQARAYGLPLGDLELLGQDEKAARGFVRAVRANRAKAYLDEVDWVALENLMASRRAGIAQAPTLGAFA